MSPILSASEKIEEQTESASNAAIVREIFDRYEERGSAIHVAQILNDKQIATKQYDRKSGHANVGKKWCKAAVLRVLKNPVYAGFISYGDERHEGEHRAIIEREQFERIEGFMANLRKHGVKHVRNPEYLLRGILKCRCGAVMTSASTRRGEVADESELIVALSRSYRPDFSGL